jgi:thiamine biosynthesis protein ThiS
MQIVINGNTIEAPADQNIRDLLDSSHFELKAAALIVNGSHLPRSMWASTAVIPNMVLEIIVPMQGG